MSYPGRKAKWQSHNRADGNVNSSVLKALLGQHLVQSFGKWTIISKSVEESPQSCQQLQYRPNKIFIWSLINGFQCAIVFSRGVNHLNTEAALDSLQRIQTLYFPSTVFQKHQPKHSLMNTGIWLPFRTQTKWQSSPAFSFCFQLDELSFGDVSCKFAYASKHVEKTFNNLPCLSSKLRPPSQRLGEGLFLYDSLKQGQFWVHTKDGIFIVQWYRSPFLLSSETEVMDLGWFFWVTQKKTKPESDETPV